MIVLDSGLIAGLERIYYLYEVKIRSLCLNRIILNLLMS